MIKQIMEIDGNMVEVLINEAGEVVEMLSNGEAVKISVDAGKGLIKNVLCNKKVLIAAGAVVVVAGGIYAYKKYKAKKEAKFEEEVERRYQERLAKENEENK